MVMIALHPAHDRGIGGEVEVRLVGDMGIGKEADVGEAESVGDEPFRGPPDGRPSGPAPPSLPRACPGSAICCASVSGVEPTKRSQKRSVAMFGSWLYCSQNIQRSMSAWSKWPSGMSVRAIGQIEADGVAFGQEAVAVLRAPGCGRWR